MRILDREKITYEVRTYDVDLEDLSAETVAKKIGLPEAQVYKTLVLRGDKTGCVFAVVAAGTELDPKALAKASGNKSCELVALKEVEPLTGYVRGGVTVLGAKKPFPVFVDESMLAHDVVSVSPGARGAQLILAPKDYVRATKAKLATITRSNAT
jgi:Cys-tRNA(Pro)/Cys-tRNA(Cys) deacylase